MRRAVHITVSTIAITMALAMLPTRGAAGDEKSSPSGLEAILAALPKATWVADGRGKRIVYLFADPNCPSCALLYRNLRKVIETDNVQIRWVPVAIVGPTSLGKAAAILQAPDRAAALRVNEEQFQNETYSGGIDEDLPSEETEKQLDANLRLFNRLDLRVVPTMLFKDRDGRALVVQGALSPVALRKVFARLP